MGCTSSSHVASTFKTSSPIDLLESQFAAAEKHDTLDVRSITMLIWKARDEPGFASLLTEILVSRAYERKVFDGIEFYLPQWVHMLVHLDIKDIVEESGGEKGGKKVVRYTSTNVFEYFALFVAQQSIHFALQVCWILVGFMEDYQMEDDYGKKNPTGNPLLYHRCASLLEKLELAVVFGSPLCNKFEELYRQGKITRDELLEIENADRKYRAMQIADEAGLKSKPEMEGFLKYKRWKGRGMLHTDGWIERRFVIQHRVLYCLRKSDNTIKRSIPLQYCKVVVPERNKHNKKFYFEIQEAERDRKFLLEAKSIEEMDKWVTALKKVINSPPSTVFQDMQKDGTADIDVSQLSLSQIARYGFYRSERDFVRDLTDICEALRFVDRSTREVELRKKLETELQIPGCVYNPLCSSTDPWQRISQVLPESSFAFSTKERCPCLMTFEVTSDDPEKPLDTATYLYQTLGFDELDDESLDESSIEQLEREDSKSSKRVAMRERFVRSARDSVTNMDLDVSEIREKYEEQQLGEENGNSKSNNNENSNNINELESRKMSIENRNQMLVDLPHLWDGDDIAIEIKSNNNNNETQNGTTKASSSATGGESKNTTNMEKEMEKYKRKSLKLEVLKQQAVQILTKKKIISTLENQNGDDESKSMGNNIASQQRKGEFLKSLGKYVENENADQQENEPDENGGEKNSPKELRNRSGSVVQIGKLIAKSNDDLRQEVFIMQLIQFLHDIWKDKKLPLILKPYHIMSTSQTCGLIEVLNATSFDGLKRKNNKIRMVELFKKHFPEESAFRMAQRNFVESMAAYSLACYILGVKDRHNGNLMLNMETGIVTHIDFGFVFMMAPGKDKIKHTDFSFEKAAFKLTPELVEVMGGKKSENWKYFNKLLVDGLLEARRHHDTLCTLIEIMGYKSKLPCFNQPGGGVQRVLRELKQRLMLSEASDAKVAKRMKSLANHAANSKATLFYERFQKWSNGIEPVL